MMLPPPRLSIIIPTYNRAGRVRACLEALCHQDAPANEFEVIVVVDGSTDGTMEMLKRLDTPYQLRVLWQENSGWSAALNNGTAAASGPVCLFLDDDIIAAPTLVGEHLRAHADAGDVVAIGQLTLQIPDNADWFVRAYAESWSSHYSELGAGREPTWADCFGGNLSVSRSMVQQVGGLPVELARGRDIEFGYRLHQAGMRFVYLRLALGHQDERKTFRQLAIDCEKAGAAWIEVYRRHPPVLPELLGSYHHTRVLSRVLQYLGLALSIPPVVMRRLIQFSGKRDYRAFHFLRNYCYWRGVKRAADRDLWRRLTSGTRILMYHAFGGDGEPAGAYVTPARRFSRQLVWLRRLGFHFISLDEYIACRREHRLPPARAAVVTIDDGYLDARTHAVPILSRLGIPATLFVVSHRVAAKNTWASDTQLAERPLMSWDEIRQTLDTGITIGAHSRTHPNLTLLPLAEAREEMEGSRTDIERRLGTVVLSFAYPYGALDSRIREVAERAGFLGSCGIRPGVNTVQTPLQDISRLEIFGTDSVARVVIKVALGRAHLPALGTRGWRRHTSRVKP